MILWNQHIRDLWVINSSTYFSCDELRYFLVCFWICQDIFEITLPYPEPRTSIEFFPERQPYFLRDLKRSSWIYSVYEARLCLSTSGKDVRIFVSNFDHLFLVYFLVMKRGTPIRSSLKNGQMSYRFCDFLYSLDP